LSTPRRELLVVASIRELDAVTIGQIAAGEIIDRPASIVKELVENAVDAGANRITVIAERGGLDLIEVIDNGAGIASEDLSLALRRHSTSKLRTAEELESVATLGFRGEGLASVVAVARTEILTRRPESALGARIAAHVEASGEVEPAPAPVGTSVRVSGLFENVPVRREYLRSAAAEFGRLSSWLSTFALAYPHCSFTLRHDGRDVWVMPATTDPRERMAMVFGREAAAALITLDSGAARMLAGKLSGFISAPGSDRPDRRLQVLFVNGRLLRSALLGAAWTSGYATFMMTGRHPYGVIYLELPPGHVDVNVHPTKSDVRLRYGDQVFAVVRSAIAATLNGHARARANRQHEPSDFLPASPAGAASSISLFDASFDESTPSRGLRILTQLERAYIVALDGEGLLLVDQHAAHERVAYEAIVSRARGDAPSEPLLVPLIVELDPARGAVLDTTLDALREGGLEIEPFGERTYRIVSTPAGYAARQFDLDGFIDDLSDEPKQRSVRERVWASLACHSVTVAGEPLEIDEMRVLIERLRTCENPMHCPHGRPTMIRLAHDDIARLFKRV
jgi:DNA mismatch repair protein MutL